MKKIKYTIIDHKHNNKIFNYYPYQFFIFGIIIGIIITIAFYCL